MKNHISLILLGTAFCLILFSACSTQIEQKTNATYSKNIEAIPKLLDRNEALFMGKEWDNIQNQYGTNRAVVSKDPQNVAALLTLMQIFVGEARVTGEHGHYYPAALALAERALAIPNLKDDDAFQVLSLKAGVLLSLHQFQNALEVGEKAVVLNPHNAHIRGVLVDAYVELGKYTEAVEQADKMISLRPDLRSYSRISYLREIHGDVQGAQKALKMAVEAGAPSSEETAWAMLTLGDLYREYGKKAIAREIYSQILMERPNYPFAVAALAMMDYESGKTKEAEAGLSKAIDIIPEVGFYVDLAKIYKETGRESAASRLVADIFKMLQEDTEAGHVMNLEFADVFGELAGDWKSAKVFAQKEYDARPDNIDVNLKMAKICKALQQDAAAKQHLAVAKRTQSKKPELLELMAAL